MSYTVLQMCSWSHNPSNNLSGIHFDIIFVYIGWVNQLYKYKWFYIFINIFMYVFHAQVSIPIICTLWGYPFCQYYNTYTLRKQTQSADNSYHQYDWIDDYQVHCTYMYMYYHMYTNIIIIIWFSTLTTKYFDLLESIEWVHWYLRILNEYISILNTILMSTLVLHSYSTLILKW